MRKTFVYRGCVISPIRVEKPILAGCNGGVNRYFTRLWLVTFPDGTWIRVGTKDRVRAYINSKGYAHGVVGERK